MFRDNARFFPGAPQAWQQEFSNYGYGYSPGYSYNYNYGPSYGYASNYGYGYYGGYSPGFGYGGIYASAGRSVRVPVHRRHHAIYR
jgi:hypothetical protein